MDGEKDVEDVWMLGVLTMNYNVLFYRRKRKAVSQVTEAGLQMLYK